MATLVAEAEAELAEQGYTAGIEVTRALEMRYLGQNYELELAVTEADLANGATQRLWQSFHAAHEARFGFAIPGEIVEIVNYTTTVVSRTPKPELPRLGRAEADPVPIGDRPVRYTGGVASTPIYRRDTLRHGHALAGPALIEEAASVTVVEPGQLLTVDAFGHLLIKAAGV